MRRSRTCAGRISEWDRGCGPDGVVDRGWLNFRELAGSMTQCEGGNSGRLNEVDVDGRVEGKMSGGRGRGFDRKLRAALG